MRKTAQERLGQHLAFREISKNKGDVCEGAVQRGQRAWHTPETCRR